jgi:hypothetical protein
MRLSVLGLALAVAMVLVTVSPASGLETDWQATRDYLKTQQNPDGGFGNGFTPESSVGSTADAVLAILAFGGEIASFDRGGNTPLTYLAQNASSASSAGDLSKLILALVPAREDPRTFGGMDSVARLEALIGADGRIGGPNDTFVSTLMAVLALKSAGRPIPAASLELIRKAQQASGGWAWDGTAATAVDTNTTAFAVQALVAGGEAAGGSSVTRALEYYKGIQNSDGGWPYQNPSDFDTETDANSTALTIQAILAAGQDPAGANWITAEGTKPLAALQALQNPSGGLAWKASARADNLLATVQAVPALAGKILPMAATGPTPATGGSGPRVAWIVAIVAVIGLVLIAGGVLLLKRRR